MLKLLNNLFKKEKPVEVKMSREEALRIEAIKDKESQDRYFLAKENEMNKKKEQLMKAVPMKTLHEGDISFLSQKGVIDHMNVWISLYLKDLQKINIKNPKMIKINQDIVKEYEQIIKKNPDDAEAIQAARKGITVTLENIEKLKDEVDPDNVGHIMYEYVDTIKSLKILSESLPE